MSIRLPNVSCRCCGTAIQLRSHGPRGELWRASSRAVHSDRHLRAIPKLEQRCRGIDGRTPEGDFRTRRARSARRAKGGEAGDQPVSDETRHEKGAAPSKGLRILSNSSIFRELLLGDPLPLVGRIIHISDLTPIAYAELDLDELFGGSISGKIQEEISILALRLCPRIRCRERRVGIDEVMATPFRSDQARPEPGVGHGEDGRPAVPVAAVHVAMAEAWEEQAQHEGL